MTPTEAAASTWLVRERGYDPEAVAFQYRTSPDFRTSDGRGWEVKRVVRGRTTFYLSQLVIFRKHAPTVLFWADGQDEPIAESDFRALPMPGTWDGLRIYVWHQPRYALPHPLHSAASVEAAIAAEAVA